MKNNFDLKSWDDFQVVNNSINSTNAYETSLCFLDFLKQLPQKELIKNGWVNKSDDVSSLVPLFNEIMGNQFQTLFRRSSSADDTLLTFWLSKISMLSKQKIINGSVSAFKGLSKSHLKEIAQLSVDESNVLRLPDILASHGVILVYERSIPGMKVDGAVFKLFSGNPVIGISFRYPRLDHFWFTLMHELSHIVLHLEQLDTPIIDDLEDENKEIVELEANMLAKNSFVEKAIWRNCPPKYALHDKAILYEFAKSINIHPAIIAGLLRHEKNNYTIYNQITNNNIRKVVFGDE